MAGKTKFTFEKGKVYQKDKKNNDILCKPIPKKDEKLVKDHIRKSKIQDIVATKDYVFLDVGSSGWVWTGTRWVWVN